MRAIARAVAYAATMLVVWLFLSAIGAIAFYWWVRIGEILWEFLMEGKL